MRVTKNEEKLIDVDDVRLTQCVILRDVSRSYFQLRRSTNGWDWYPLLTAYISEGAKSDLSFHDTIRKAMDRQGAEVHAFESESQAIRWIAEQYED